MSTKRGSSSDGHSTRKRHHHRESEKGEEQDIFWYPSLNTHPPDNYVTGMIPLLKKALTNSRSRGRTRRAVLCWEQAIYLSGQSFDRAWGCGYRNFMMACASLVERQDQPMYFPLLDSPISPSVRQLQLWLEIAWSDGYDHHGAQQLKNLVGTTKWIGVSDLYTAFSCRGIPCELVDFNYNHASESNTALIRWIVNYFSPDQQPRPANATAALMADTIITTEKMPIILQDGLHSRTVVGYEEVDATTTHLLVFDPSRRPRSKIRQAALNLTSNPSSREGINDELLHDAVSYFRYHVNRNVFKKQWQVLYFPMTDPLTETQMARRKFVTSTRA